MKNAIKQYFEELIKTDEAIKAVYDENKLDDCIKYLQNQAYKVRNGNCAAVRYEIVYKWARGFMLGDIPEEEKISAPKNEKLEINQVYETPVENIQVVEKKEKKSKKPAIDDGQQMLFDF